MLGIVKKRLFWYSRGHAQKKENENMSDALTGVALPFLPRRKRRERVLAKENASEQEEGACRRESALGTDVMPGISQECEAGQHHACMMGLECRCPHHSHTQQLLREGPKKSDPRGGIRRNVRAKIKEAAAKMPELALAEPDPAELYTTCPKCKGKAKATDQFCRKDGTRLCLGRPCQQCAAPCEEEDAFCWQCGHDLSKSVVPIEMPPLALPSPGLPSQEPLASSTESRVEEDPIVRLQRVAREQGLLPKETVVS